METLPHNSKFHKALEIIFAFLLTMLTAGFVVLIWQVRNLENQLAQKVATQTPVFSTVPRNITSLSDAVKNYCDENCQKMLVNEINNAVATIAATLNNLPKGTSAPVATTKPSGNQTSYVSLGGSGSTKNTDWTDIAGTGVYIDLKNDYSSSAYVTWDAFLQTVNGGTVFVRLYDATNNIAVLGSEISTSNTTLTQIFSGKLNLWAGKNLYKVQIKSLDSNTATFGSGRIKIVY